MVIATVDIEVNLKTLADDSIVDRILMSSVVPAEDPHFGKLRPDAERIRDLSSRLLELPLERLQASSVQGIQTHLNLLTKEIEEVEAVPPTQLFQDTQSHASRLQGPISAYDKAAVDLIGELATVWPDAVAQNLAADLNDLRQQAENALAEAASVLDTARQAAVETAVTREAKTFASRSAVYDRQARIWLVAAGLLVALAMTYVVIFYLVVAIDTDTTQATIATIAGRFLPLSLILFGLAQALRNYNAAQHNMTANEHRADALTVFQTFVDGARGDDIRDAILLEATRSVFRATPSGYLKDGAAETQAPNTTLEVIRRLGSE